VQNEWRVVVDDVVGIAQRFLSCFAVPGSPVAGFGPPQELIKNQHVYAQISGGGFGYDEDRVLTRRHLKPKTAQFTPHSKISSALTRRHP
jgi:hypothetical protein